MKIEIVSAKSQDIRDIFRLIRSEQKFLLYRNKINIKKHLDNFVVARAGDGIIGCASFENYSPEIAEIRSLVVLPQYRSKGVGKKLIKTLLKRRRKHQKVFVVTSKVAYFEKLKFHNCLGEKYIMFMR